LNAQSVLVLEEGL